MSMFDVGYRTETLIKDVTEAIHHLACALQELARSGQIEIRNDWKRTTPLAEAEARNQEAQR